MNRLPFAAFAAAVGWFLFCLSLSHFGWWLGTAAWGLGLTAACLAVLVRDSLVRALVAYWSPSPATEEGSSKPEPHSKQKRWIVPSS